jgi:flagellar hook-associated protein 1 FlgK
MSTYNIGVSALAAAQTGVLTASHNISNASTAGFSRQQIIQTTNTPMFTGSGFVGQGTSVQTVRRIYDQYVSRELLSAQTGAAEMDGYLAQIKQIDNLLADPNAGLSPALSSFFKGVQDLAASPSSVPARQAVLSGAQALVARFQSLDQRITEVRDGVNQQVVDEISTINSLATQLGDINQRIIIAQAAGSNQPANDLLDQREQLISDINKEIRTQTVRQSDGTYSVFFGNGQPLVVGTQVSTLVAIRDNNDPEKITLGLKTPYGTDVQLSESLVTGGTLGGLLSFRAESLDPVENALGRVAIGLAQAFNEIHRLGQDLAGNTGEDFFTVPSPVVNAGALNATEATVLSARIVSSDYQVSFGAGNTFSVFRLTDSMPRTAIATGTAAVGATTSLNLDGVPVVISIPALGSAGNGDSFVIRPGNAAGSRVIAESDNTGNATLDSAGSNIQALAVSDYRLDVTDTPAGGGNYQVTLTRLSDNQSWVGSDTASFAGALADLATKQQVGFSLSFSGTAPSLNDSFVIQPTRTGARDIGLAISDPAMLAAAMPVRTAASVANKGAASIDAGMMFDKSYLPLPADVTLTFDSAGNRFIVSGAVPPVGPIAYNPSTETSKTISFNGASFTIAGKPANGDTFVLSNNANGVADNRTMQLLGKLQTQQTLDGTPGSTSRNATATFQDAYAQIVSRVGNKTREVEVTGKAQQSLADQAQAARDQISGVNLDEEAAKLLQYQQAYQAAAKMLDIAGKLFDEVLALGR